MYFYIVKGVCLCTWMDRYIKELIENSAMLNIVAEFQGICESLH